ncbi:hypothetical protein [Micromonospora inyonensis]|uniref:Uncharacterized protein n=1 Tax=Micromonospora inyonensis TaxID=47866 RepID=A0A1C6SNV6_9ACTN|nr:hypothetical protein [Micromonospora inyonensis]SCL31214.1 hypothetical protein GA0074694_5918 [Micromonospora inyonensis]
MIETVAAALGVAPGILLGRRVQRAPATDATTAIERVREALASYHTPGTANRDRPPSVAALDHQVGYACSAYRHAHHAQVLRMLPDLLAAARPAHHPTPTAGALLLVRVYRLTAQTLVKLGEPHLAWLAADRAMTTAAGDPCRTALAAVPLAQALRTLHRGRLALTVATTAVCPLDLTPHRESPPDHLALAGTLLTEAALAAATCGDPAAVDDLTDRAAHLAVTLHHRATTTDAWHRLPAEHRAAHLIDITRAHLDLGDHRAAGRALLTADQIAPAEVRLRPAAHTILTVVLRAGPTPADLTRLAATIGLAVSP